MWTPRTKVRFLMTADGRDGALIVGRGKSIRSSAYRKVKGSLPSDAYVAENNDATGESDFAAPLKGNHVYSIKLMSVRVDTPEDRITTLWDDFAKFVDQHPTRRFKPLAFEVVSHIQLRLEISKARRYGEIFSTKF